jgi:hypothetical protein
MQSATTAGFGHEGVGLRWTGLRRIVGDATNASQRGAVGRGLSRHPARKRMRLTFDHK